MKNIVLVGAGRVGRAFLDTTAGKHEFVVVDPYNEADVKALRPGLGQVAVVATPGIIAPEVISKCFEYGYHVLDISFHNRSFYKIGSWARRHGLWYVPDAGFAPGIMNALVNRVIQESETLPNIRAYVGGVPVKRFQPWQYASTWNTSDHLEEYIRPARYIENGEIKEIDPLESDYRIVTVPGIGTMEGFCSDGLRSLLETRNELRNAAEFTLRWPGFINNMRLIKASGLLEPNMVMQFAHAIENSGAWEFRPEDLDLSVLLVEGGGIRYKLIHQRQPEDRHSSMSWCTAVGAAAALEAMLYNDVSQVGTCFVEDLVEHDVRKKIYNTTLRANSLEVKRY